MADVFEPLGGGQVEPLLRQMAQLRGEMASLKAAVAQDQAQRRSGTQAPVGSQARSARANAPYVPTAARGGVPLQPRILDQATEAQAKLNRVNMEGVPAASAQREAQERLYQQYSRGPNALRRYGALTTEFFSALARGETTVREVGFQVGATIAKFAGWTAAATAVYGAFAALSAIGRGATDTADGVNKLDRVMINLNKDAAGAQINELAGTFNLPIADVADAAYEMGKRFRTLPETIEATRVALLAMKVGELDAAESTRFLTSIVNGFQLSAGDLTPVFDALDQVQNHFGVSIRDTTAGVAKAAGVVRAAGGDYRTLIALVSTGSRVTGRTGEEIGTAIGRSAEILSRPDRRKLLEEQFGISADADFNAVYAEAFKQAQSGALTQGEVVQLAGALSTPLLATRIAPILQNQDQYNKIFKDIDPKTSNVTGAGQRELDTQLNSFSEHMNRIVTNLERFGSALASAGVLAPIQTLVDVLGAGLDITGRLLGVFNLLPRPVKETAAVLAGVVATLRLMRRFNVGELFGPGSRIESSRLAEAFTNRGAVQRRTLRRAATTQLQEAEDATRATYPSAIGAARTAEATRIAADRAYREFGTEDHKDVQRLRGVAKVAAERSVAAEAEFQLATHNLALAREREAAVVSGLRKGVDPRLISRTTQIGVPGQLDGSPYVPGQVYRPGMDTSYGAAVRAAQRDATGAGHSGNAWDAYARSKGIDATTQEAERRANTSTRVLSRAGNTVKGVGQSLWSAGRLAAGGVATAAGGLLAMLGPLDLLILAAAGLAFGIPKLIEELNRSGAEVSRFEKSLEDATTRQAQRAIVERARAAAQKGATFGETVTDAFGGFGAGILGQEYVGATDIRQQQERSIADAAEARLRLAGRSIRRGDVIPQATHDEINRAVQADFDEFNRGAKTLKELRETVRNRILSIKGSANYTPEQKDQTIALIQGRLLDAGATKNAFQQATDLAKDPEGLADFTQGYTDLFAAGKASADDAKKRLQLAFATTLGRGNSAADRAFVAEQFQAAAEDIVSEGNGVKTVQRAYHEEVQGIRDQIDRKSREIADTQKERRRLNAKNLGAGDHIGSQIIGRDQELKERLETLKQNVKAKYDAIDEADKRERQEIEAVKEALRAREREKFANQQRIPDLRAQLEAAQAGSDKAGQRILLDRAQEKLTDTLATPGIGKEAILQARLDVANQQKALHDQEKQEAEDLIGLRAELAKTQTTDPAKEAALELSAAAKSLAAVRADPKSTAGEVLQAQIAYGQAKESLAELELQQAEELAQARLSLAQARAEGDPVAQARLTIQDQKRQIDAATDPNQKKALGIGLKQQRLERYRAVTNSRITELDFEQQMERITADQEAKALERILRTRKLGLQEKRDLMLKIKQLRDQSDDAGSFQLNPGDLKLPTIYEIRRAIGSGDATGAAASARRIDASSNIAVNVYTDGDNVRASASDRSSRTTARSTARARGLR